MKTLLRLWLLALALAFVPFAAQAQAPGASLPCDGKLYQTRQDGTNLFTTLYRVNRTTTPYTTDRVQLTGQTNTATYGNLSTRLNAVGYNQRDNYLYAVTYIDVNGASPNPGSVINLYKIGLSGDQLVGRIYVGTIATPLARANYAGGAIDKDGIMYISTETATNTMYRINLNTVVVGQPVIATAVSLGANYALYDMAINPLDGLIYATTNEGALRRMEVNTLGTSATVTNISSSASVNGGAHPVGTLFFDAAGTLLAASNGTFGGNDVGNFYVIDLPAIASTGRSVWVRVTTLPRSQQSDGSSCIFPPEQLDVVKDLISVRQVSGQANGVAAYDVKYLIKVKNTAIEVGNNAENIQVNDFLFRTATNDNTTNITFPTANLVGNGTSASRIDSVFVKDDDASVAYTRNNAFNGTNGTNGSTSALLTTGQTLNQGKTIFIRVSALVRFPSNTVPTIAQLNTAIASSASTVNNGYRIDDASGSNTGILLPPIDLLDADQSTDGPTLPSTPKGDSPSPTPLTFGGGITGVVFEDVNYGGGNGRSQAASDGVGVSDVRVELYNANNTFNRFTTTDADGFYVFSNLTAGTSYTVRVVNGSVKSTRPGGTTTGILPVQTYANASKVGGNNPDVADAGNGANNITLSTTTMQSTVSIAAVAGDPAVVDFGFNFDLIVNTNNNGQGSLNQFIFNSNALQNDNSDASTANDLNQAGLTAGVETSIFMIPTAALTNGVAVITLTSALPNITDSRTAIDGSRQTAFTGNSAPASTTAGAETTGPEVTINFNTQAGLLVTGGNTLVASLGLNNARGASNQQGAGLTFNTASAAGSVVTDVTATGNNRTGIRVEGGVNNVSVTNNVLNSNLGNGTIDADGLELLGTTNATVTGNVISGNRGYGIFMTTAANTGATVANNTIRNNGTGTSTADAGISIGADSDNNTFRQNIITGNAGDGIVALAGAAGNLFTQNSFSTNGNLGIDLSANTTETGDNTSLNANGKTAASGANGLLNFPVVSQAAITNVTNGNLVISGYAPLGSTIELFVADRTASDFGQGQTYLLSLTEGGTLNGIADADNRTSSYSGNFNGLNHGSETNASRFYYTIPLASLTAPQRVALTANGARLTATATTAGNTTSEFSGNLLVSQNSPLPVTLTSFTAQANGQDTELAWTTAQEVNNDHFVVERSLDGQAFLAISEVKGQGTKATTTTYSAVDAQAGAKAQGRVVYYRLRQVDTDGTQSLSSVQTVSFPTAARATANVHPNPATSSVDARLDLSGAAQGTYQVTITDMTGRTVRTLSRQGGTNDLLEVTTLTTGIYLVQVQGNGQVFTKRLIKE